MLDLLGPTGSILKLALDAASLRHQTIANNIANVNTPGYAPLKVNFEEQLSALKDGMLGGKESDWLGKNIKPFVENEPSANAGSANVMLDMETLKLSQNAVHFEALAKMLGKRMSILSAAVSEGKK